MVIASFTGCVLYVYMETSWKIFNRTNKKLQKYFGGLKKVRIFAKQTEVENREQTKTELLPISKI